VNHPARVKDKASANAKVFSAEKQAKARRATVRVIVPAGARLTINGKATQQKGGSRRFITRRLHSGKKHAFIFKAEFKRGHKTVTVSRKVRLRAGQSRVISLGSPEVSSRYRYGANRRPSNRNRVYRFGPGPSTVPSSGRYSTSEFLVWPNGY
jgi:uncharacterized protein (TIGR03000 family)